MNTPQRLRVNVLTKEIQDLLNEVRQLREDTESLVCNCNDPDCPFEESHLATIYKQPEDEFSILSESPRTRRTGISNMHSAGLSLPNSLKGIEKRRDGTIVERDGPRSISSEDSLEKRMKKSHMNFLIGQHLSVSNTALSESEDCLVDNDNQFGTSSDDDSTFSRFEVSRKQVRRHHTKSAKLPKRRANTMCTSCSTLPGQMRKCSVGSDSHRFSQHLRNASSLPSCDFFENDEFCLSSSSSSSSISTTQQHVPCHHTNFARQHSALIVTR